MSDPLTMAQMTKTALDVLERELGNAWKPVYCKVKAIDGKWYITEGPPSVGTVVKGGLTSEEADAWLRLLQE